MTAGMTQAAGALLLVACGWWALGAVTDIATVAPTHWGLLLPHLALDGVPALVGVFTAGALLFGRPGARALTLAFAVAVAQAAAISALAPELSRRYTQTVEQGKELRIESLPPRVPPLLPRPKGEGRRN